MSYSFQEFWLLIAFSFSDIMAWDHLYMIYYLTLLPFRGSYAVTPLDIKMWGGRSLEIVFQTSFTSELFTGVKWDFNECMPVRNTVTRRHSYALKHSLSLKILVNKEPWCFHCNQKFASLFKIKRRDSKVLNQKKKKHQIVKARKPATSIRKTKQFIYVQQEKENKKFPTPENI